MNEINHELLRYLIWGQCSRPARFKYLRDFEAWCIEHGLDTGGCRDCWLLLRTYYRDLYGTPIFKTTGTAV